MTTSDEKHSTPRNEKKSMRTGEGIAHENVAGYSPSFSAHQSSSSSSTSPDWRGLSRLRAGLFLRTMDNGDIYFTNPETYLRPAMGTDPHDSCSMSMDSYFDDILKDPEHLACTNILLAESDDVAETSESPHENDGHKKKHPSGNRAAVRRYREKKKAHTTLLEEEVARLKALNTQLVRRLQSQSALEAEASRLRCLLVDIRGRIEGELGAFPYKRSVKNNDSADQGSSLGGAQMVRLRCNNPVYCSPETPATTMDDNVVMSGELLGQGTGDIANKQWLPGLPDDVKR